MKRAIKAQWLEALRSGQYPKGKNELRSGMNEFCCLGVLCNLHAQAHPKIAARQVRTDQYMGNSTYLPDAVALWAGIPLRHPVVNEDGPQYTLARINDHFDTFEPVIKYIEKKL